jgi:hypothetical protein
MPTALDIVTSALQEINVVAQGEAPAQGDAAFALSKLNDLLDEWAARKVYIYDVSFPTFTLVPGLLPHTIGPAGTITNSALTNNVATYLCQNNLTNGESVTVSGTTNGGGVLNLTGRVQSATASQFSIASIQANVGSAADAGIVVVAGNAVPTFATPYMGPRPQRIDQANLILTDNSPYTELPLNIRDDEWWMDNRVKSLQSNVPTDLHYDANFPNGSLYFWPVPATSYQVRLKLWGVIPQFPSFTYTFSLPPGYQKAVKLSLARDLVGSFQGTWGQTQESSWTRAMKAVETNNIQSPRGNTINAGMPGGLRGGDFNYVSGAPNPR